MKLGVLLGHRRKLLRPIADLETNAKAALGLVVAPVADVLRETALKSFDFHILSPKNLQYT